MEITNINQLDFTSSLYTYADYILWKFKQRKVNHSFCKIPELKYQY